MRWGVSLLMKTTLLHGDCLVQRWGNAAGGSPMPCINAFHSRVTDQLAAPTCVTAAPAPARVGHRLGLGFVGAFLVGDSAFMSQAQVKTKGGVADFDRVSAQLEKELGMGDTDSLMSYGKQVRAVFCWGRCFCRTAARCRTHACATCRPPN